MAHQRKDPVSWRSLINLDDALHRIGEDASGAAYLFSLYRKKNRPTALYFRPWNRFALRLLATTSTIFLNTLRNGTDFSMRRGSSLSPQYPYPGMACSMPSPMGQPTWRLAVSGCRRCTASRKLHGLCTDRKSLPTRHLEARLPRGIQHHRRDRQDGTDEVHWRR